MELLWVCDAGQSEVFWQADTEDIRVVLKKPEALAAIRARLQAAEPSELFASQVRWTGDAFEVNGLQRQGLGAGTQFVSGPDQPSLEPGDAQWILHLRQGDNRPIILDHCEAVAPYPQTSVAITVLGDSYKQGQWRAAPLAGVTVYAGEWQANQVLGITDDLGRLRFSIEPGQQAFSVFKLTSSHSALWSDPIGLEVSTQHPNTLSIHVAPVTVRIRSTTAVAYGRALYITGAGAALGDWRTATRFTPQADGSWELLKNIPIGAPYKMIEAPWSDFAEISINESVHWESGPNHVIPPRDGYYEVVINAAPRFD